MSQPTGMIFGKLNRSVRVLVVDDHPIVRRMVCFTLRTHPQFEVCGEATDGAQAIEEAKKLKPDVVVLDVSMPVLNGFDAARKIKTVLPESAIVILSQNSDRHFVEEAKRIGVQAYVAKTKAGEALLRAVEAAVLGEEFFLAE